MENLDYYLLSDGFKIPKIGFGTYKLNGTKGIRVMESALSVGYRLLDSAFNYENEGAVGRAIKNSSVSRDQITVVSKLPGKHQKYAEATTTIQESVYRLGLDYVDMYLIHWPNPKDGTYVEAWQALIDAQKAGWIRSIGVCNFLPEHLKKLEKETGVLPVVNQIEMHPYFNQSEQIAFDKSKGILSEAWSPLGRASAVLKEKVLASIAETHRKSISQIILRWQIQLGIMTIPKSSSVSRQMENIDIFDFNLSLEEVQKINALTKKDGRTANQDPAVYTEY